MEKKENDLGAHVRHGGRDDLASHPAPDAASHVVLVAARGFVERGWTQGWYGKTSPNGFHVDPKSPEAKCWCSEGAFIAADGIDSPARDIFKKVISASGLAGPGAIVQWNDNPRRSKEEVLAAFDKAIALAEGRS